MVWRVLVHAAAGALLAAGLVAQLVRPLAPDLGALPDLGRWFDAAYLVRSHAYRGPLYAAGLVALGLRVAVPLAVAFTPAGRRVVERVVARVGANRPARAAAAVALGIAAATELVLLPLAFWASYVHEGAFGFRTQGLVGWARDHAIGVAIGWIATVVVVLGAWSLARRLPRT
jgi:hypothetical protein